MKGVLLERSPEGVRFLRMAVSALPQDLQPPERAQAIRSVVQSLRDDHEVRIVTAVSGSNAVLRSVLFPRMSPQELKAALAFEAEKYIPFKLDETYLDFFIVGNRPAGRMEVLLAAARNDLVDSHVEMLQSAGITPSAVDLEPLALSNALELSHPLKKAASAGPRKRPAKGQAGAEGEGKEMAGTGEVVALLHVGARATILVALMDSCFEFSRESSIGGAAFSRAVAQGLRLDGTQAEELKLHPDSRGAEVRSLLQPVWESWVVQCRASLDFYENQFGHKVQRFMISGGSARLSGFKEWLQETLGLPTEEWDPAAALKSEVDPQQLESHRPVLAVAVGLAVRELL